MLLKKPMQEIDFSTLLNVKGVDGFLILDKACAIIDAQVPSELNRDLLAKACDRFIQTNKRLGNIEQSIFLTERGVLALAEIEDFYLVIVAGYTESVDVAKLSNLINQIKMSLSIE